MSGGSMDYLYYKVEDATFIENTPLRKALRLHLKKLAKALKAVEWNDSGDGDDDEDFLIATALGCTQLKESIQYQIEENEAETQRLLKLRDFLKEL